MNKPLVLVVEDDTPVRNLITTTLKTHEYRYLSAQNGASAVMEALSHNPDIVLLDLGLPDMDGVEIIRKIRSWSNMPIIVISARTEDSDKIVALDAGADDYLTKPFRPTILLMKVKALLRRVERAKVIAKNSENEKILNFGSLVIDPAQRLVTVNGEQVHLTPTEFDLLVTLARKPKSVLTREKLLEEVWDWVDASGTRTVDSHVKALRHKLGSETIRTVHGVGYAFEPPEQ